MFASYSLISNVFPSACYLGRCIRGRAMIPVFADMLASASLISPNTIQIIYLAEEQGVTEIQTHKFTAAGIEVSLHYGGK